jgi:hypothetical protein
MTESFCCHDEQWILDKLIAYLKVTFFLLPVIGKDVIFLTVLIMLRITGSFDALTSAKLSTWAEQ